MMDHRKRTRLQARGWRVGSAAEFLELSREEQLLIDMKLRLATALRERRQRAGWTQAQLAESLATSQSRVAKMEASDASVSLDLLVRSLLALGASPKDVSRAVSGARAAA